MKSPLITSGLIAGGIGGSTTVTSTVYESLTKSLSVATNEIEYVPTDGNVKLGSTAVDELPPGKVQT